MQGNPRHSKQSCVDPDDCAGDNGGKTRATLESKYDSTGQIYVKKVYLYWNIGNQNKNINDPKKSPHAYDISRPMMAKPMKPLELHYTVILFRIC